MTFFQYLFILTLALTIHCIKSSFIPSSDDGLISNKSNIELYKNRFKKYLRDSEDRIVGGNFVKNISEYSFMAYVYLEVLISPLETHIGWCGATLLSQTFALSSASCFHRCNCGPYIDDQNCLDCRYKRVENFELYVGNIVPKYSDVRSKLAKYHIHPEFKHFDSTHMCRSRFDIAVLELKTPIPNSIKISYVKLPDPVTLGKDDLSSTMTSSFFNNKNICKVLGWGRTYITDSTGVKSERLKVAAVPLFGSDMCAKYFRKIDVCSDTSICSKSTDGKTGVCLGDTGGPIICDGVQVGVAAYALPTCTGPDGYTRVDINVNWIRTVIYNTIYDFHIDYDK